MSEHLKTQPTPKPVRKVRWGAYAVAALTVATYVAGVIQGEELVSQEAALQALGVLAGGVAIVGTEYMVKEEA